MTDEEYLTVTIGEVAAALAVCARLDPEMTLPDGKAFSSQSKAIIYKAKGTLGKKDLGLRIVSS